MPRADRAHQADTDRAERAALGAGRGLTPTEFARLIRKSADWVRAEIAAGRLGAINVGKTQCGKPRFVILPQHVDAFVRARAAAPPPKPSKRPRRASGQVDFFPD